MRTAVARRFVTRVAALLLIPSIGGGCDDPMAQVRAWDDDSAGPADDDTAPPDDDATAPTDDDSGGPGDDDATPQEDDDTTPEEAGPADPSAELLEAADVLRFDLYLPEASAGALASDPYAYVQGSFGYRADYLPRVGIRLKGQVGSFRTLDEKAAFKVSFDAFDEGVRYRGLEGLTLNNMVQDASYVRETLAYALYRAMGVPAPRTAHAEVYVNDELFGLYLLVEGLDDPFLERWFADPGGNLYEGAYGVDLWPDHLWYFEHEEGPGTDRSDLAALIDAAQSAAPATFLEDLSPVLDVAEFVSMAAVDAVLGHWDGYVYTSNNYHLYHQPDSGRFVFVPWGTDQTWNAGWDPYSFGAVLGRGCLESPGCLHDYRVRLWQATDVLAGLDLQARLDERYETIHAAVYRDPRREFGLGMFEDQVASVRAALDVRGQELLDELFPDGVP